MPSVMRSTRPKCHAIVRGESRRCGQYARTGSLFCRIHAPVWQVGTIEPPQLMGRAFVVYNSDGNYVRPFKYVQRVISVGPEMVALLQSLQRQVVVDAETHAQIARVLDHIGGR